MNEYELICLALEEIRKQAYNVQQAKQNQRVLLDIHKNDPKYSLFIDSVRQHDLVLKRTLESLRDNVLEYIAEYNNGIDNLSSIDIALSITPFDLIYGRTQEGDYE